MLIKGDKRSNVFHRYEKSKLTIQITESSKSYSLLDNHIARNTDQLQFNDPYYPQQWYLHNVDASGHDLNVLPVWKMGWTGKGVTLSVLDDGLMYSNMDLFTNYEPAVSCSIGGSTIGGLDADPTPDVSSLDNSHGTYCAAIMAAVANNSYCGVGVAYDAKVGGVKLLNGPVTDLQEAMALSHGLNKVDVFSASWGPRDDGTKVDGPGRLATAAFKKGIQDGRSGKGVIYVWAVGNGGMLDDNCNLDGYASSIYTLSVNALTKSGLSCFYDEPCASTLASVYVGSQHKNPDQYKLQETRNIVVPELDGHCRHTFEGTSAAAPLAAGLVALILQANPSLSWRDVQHIVVHTAKQVTNGPGWRTNGAGFHYHLVNGFGALDGLKMVTAAMGWTNVEVQRKLRAVITDSPVNITANMTTVLPVNIPESGEGVSYLEHVVLALTLNHKQRGKLELFIISPSGTLSQILTERKFDKSTSGFEDWHFSSVHFWGESPTGVWILLITSHSDILGSVNVAKITLYGCVHHNNHVNNN